MQSKKVELKNISEKPFSLRDKINRAKINIEKIRRKRKVKHAFYALGSIAFGFGSAGGGIWTLISLIKSIDAGEKKRVLQYYNDAENKWAGSIYNSALLKSINKTCQEIAPLQFNIQSERCKIKLIDPNDDVYDHCFSKDNPLVLDEDCKQMFGEFKSIRPHHVNPHISINHTILTQFH